MSKTPLFSDSQIATALHLYDTIGSMPKVVQLLGYPCVSTLSYWVKKYPELRKPRTPRHWKQASLETKLSAIHRCITGQEAVKSVAEDLGYTTVTVCGWIKKYTGKGTISLMGKPDSSIPSNPEKISSADDLEALKAQMLEMQMEIDILKETINVLKKDPGVNQAALKNREKAVIIDALRSKYSLPNLCRKLDLPRSSYYYQEKVFQAADKYCGLVARIRELFADNYQAYGYRRIHFLLKKGGISVSEKVVRRLMKQDGLCVKQHRKRSYNSYRGEISPAAENLIQRDFHADKPNQKWLTDITEFSIKAGKVYLSPVIDCLDGMPVSWTIGTSPNAELANTMLRKAIATLDPTEKPIIHSDRGCHYRWPEWLDIVAGANLTRSMSKKGCSPDNSACEGFFGHLKTEMFYGRNWDSCSLNDFMRQVDDYMHWYCTGRIKTTLGGFTPLEFRRRIGVGV